MVRRASGEGAELRRRHAHGTRAPEQILQADLRLAVQRAGEDVERGRAGNLVHRADLQVILKIRPDAGRIDHDLDAVPAQKIRRSDAGELQDLRRSDAAGAQNYFARSARTKHFATVPHLNPGAARALRSRLEQKTRDLSLGPHLKIGAAFAARAQERFGCVPAPAVLLIHLEVGHALVVAAVEVAGFGNPGLLRGLHKGIENVPAQPLFLDAPLAADPVELAAAAMMVLMLPEGRQYIGPAPRIVAGEARPLIVVARLAAHVNH